MSISLTQLANLFFFVSLIAIAFHVVTTLVLCDVYVRAFTVSGAVDSNEIMEATPLIFLLFSVSLIGLFVWCAVGGFCKAFA